MPVIQPETNNQQPRKVDLAAVRALAEPLAAAHGMLVVEVDWVARPAGPVLRVTIEREVGDLEMAASMPGGATIDDCVRVSRDLSAALDVEETIAQGYNLEVSSPGLDRPLRSARDFQRQLGKLAKVKLVESAGDGQRVLRGNIVQVGEESVSMDVDGNVHEVRLANVSEARLVFEIGGQPKKRTRGKSARSTRKRRSAGKTAG